MKKQKRYYLFKEGNHYEIDDASAVDSTRIVVKTKAEANEVLRLLNTYGKMPKRPRYCRYKFAEVEK